MFSKFLELIGVGKGSTFKSDRLEDELIRAMEEEKLNFLGSKYAPSKYLIYCNKDEYQRIRKLEQEFRTQYENFIKDRVEKKKYSLAGTKIELKLQVDEDLEVGNYRVDASLDKVPDEGSHESEPKKKSEKLSKKKERTNLMKDEKEKEKPKPEAEEPSSGKTRLMPHAKLAVIKGLEKKEYQLTKDELIVGRHGDIELNDPKKYVSSQHFQLTRSDKDYLIKDLDSTNGTELNDELITEQQKLEDGDIIRIGDVELKFTKG